MSIIPEPPHSPRKSIQIPQRLRPAVVLLSLQSPRQLSTFHAQHHNTNIRPEDRAQLFVLFAVIFFLSLF